MSTKLTDLFPLNSETNNVFSVEERDAAESVLGKSEGGLAHEAYVYATTVPLPKKDGEHVNIFPDGFLHKVASKLDEVLPNSSLASKVALFVRIGDAISKGQNKVMQERSVEEFLNSSEGFDTILDRIFGLNKRPEQAQG